MPMPSTITRVTTTQPGWLVCADDLEILVDEDVVRPVDADVVNLVLPVAQLHNTVDNAPGVGGQRSFRRTIRCWSKACIRVLLWKRSATVRSA